MIAFVETSPMIDLHGEHFLVTVKSGTDEIKLMLTARAFFGLKNEWHGAYAKRQIAEMEAKEKVVDFPKPKPKCRARKA
jgi:hypothetical protein